MGSLPDFLLTETITVEPREGPGPVFGPASTVRAHVQEANSLPSSAPATGAVAYRVWVQLGPSIPIGSRLTIRGITATAAAVDVNDGRTLPGPSHIEIRAERSGFLATAQVTIVRGTPTADAWGDLVDTPTVIASVPASIVEDGQTASVPADQRGGVVETYTIRLPAGTDVREGDRLTADTRTYQVVDVISPPSATGPELGTDEVQVTARRVAATSTPS